MTKDRKPAWSYQEMVKFAIVLREISEFLTDTLFDLQGREGVTKKEIKPLINPLPGVRLAMDRLAGKWIKSIPWDEVTIPLDNLFFGDHGRKRANTNFKRNSGEVVMENAYTDLANAISEASQGKIDRARLIAAAPEMYELLEQLSVTPPDEVEEIEEIRKQALALLKTIDGE